MPVDVKIAPHFPSIPPHPHIAALTSFFFLRRSVVAPSWSTSKAGDVGPVGFEAAELLKMSYRDVQKLAKKNGVRFIRVMFRRDT